MPLFPDKRARRFGGPARARRIPTCGRNPELIPHVPTSPEPDNLSLSGCLRVIYYSDIEVNFKENLQGQKREREMKTEGGLAAIGVGVGSFYAVVETTCSRSVYGEDTTGFRRRRLLKAEEEVKEAASQSP